MKILTAVSSHWFDASLAKFSTALSTSDNFRYPASSVLVSNKIQRSIITDIYSTIMSFTMCKEGVKYTLFSSFTHASYVIGTILQKLETKIQEND